jgi:hypothetical protein
MTFLTQSFEVIEVICHSRILEVLETQMFFVMNDLGRDNLAFCLTSFTQTSAVPHVVITAGLPGLCLVELFRYRSHVSLLQ